MSCPSGKTEYTSFTDAQDSIKTIQSFKRDGDRLVQRRNQKNVVSLKPYRCPICNTWHLTSQKNRF